MVVIAICGTPGTGKSELARLFEKCGFRVIHLSSFVIENKLYQGYDKARGAYIIDERKLVDKIKEVLEKNDNVVIEGIGAEVLPSKLVDICIVLTCEPFMLEKRLSERGFSYEKIQENLEAERFGVMLGEAMNNYGESKVMIFDTTYTSVEELFQVIVDELKKRGISIKKKT